MILHNVTRYRWFTTTFSKLGLVFGCGGDVRWKRHWICRWWWKSAWMTRNLTGRRGRLGKIHRCRSPERSVIVKLTFPVPERPFRDCNNFFQVQVQSHICIRIIVNTQTLDGPSLFNESLIVFSFCRHFICWQLQLPFIFHFHFFHVWKCCTFIFIVNTKLSCHFWINVLNEEWFALFRTNQLANYLATVCWVMSSVRTAYKFVEHSWLFTRNCDNETLNNQHDWAEDNCISMARLSWILFLLKSECILTLEVH